MNLSFDQAKSITEWHNRCSEKSIFDLSEVQDILGLRDGYIARDDYEVDGHFAFPADPKNFDSNYIEEDLAPDRYNNLINGQEPSEEEIKIWKEKKDSLVFEEDGYWFHFYLWLVDLPEGPVYFRSLHGDQGILDRFDGPFNSEKEALADAGNLKVN